MQQRPLDVLGSSEHKRIIIQIKNRDRIIARGKKYYAEQKAVLNVIS